MYYFWYNQQNDVKKHAVWYSFQGKFNATLD